ncbi:glutaminase [Aquamicrobium zhengzhouense]|uniref:Glutaminase n=1 Tax=Aquamicrobium zhengzhouense TaxID=2781738 RepID=A0ABS0SDU8_9HYPH|nr:glutaminase [Aquamicrobium zhengzhouense]MBI1621442.1 glutaminase [Aquamicrobium zhengzhouense]
MPARKNSLQTDQIRSAVDAVVAEVEVIESFGKVIDHIAELSDLQINRFGICVVTADGDVVTGGEADHPFPIQSISKVFALTMALEAHGDDVWKRVGREPSGDPFNSIIDLERMKGVPRNPFINAGALVVVDMLLDREKPRHEDVAAFLAEHIGSDEFDVDPEIFDKEAKGGYTNRALANLAKSFDNFHHEVDDVLKVYVRQCAIALTCRQLALAGRYLMLAPPGGRKKTSIEEAHRVRRINSLMLTCGQYDGAGDFAYRVGLPAKSGVGGGILAVVPHVASIAVWSPGLDDNGNSLLGTIALERLSERLGWSVFGNLPPKDV